MTFTTTAAGVTSAQATTDATSAVNFVTDYEDGAASLPVKVSEELQDGYELAQQGGLNAVCRDTVTGAVVPSTNSGELGFTVDVPTTAVISCVVRNQQVYQDLTVTKTAQPAHDRTYEWDVEKVAQGDRQEEVPAGEDATFTYDVTVTPSGPGECSGEVGTDGGGFRNAARLVSGDLDETSRDCLEPAAPTVDKEAGELVAGEDGTWTVTYVVVVDNPSDTHDLAYDLSDSLGFAEGVAIGSATVTRGETAYEEWDGVDVTTIVTGEVLPTGATHSYTVTVVVSLLQVIDDDVRDCDVNGSNAGQGLFKRGGRCR